MTNKKINFVIVTCLEIMLLHGCNNNNQTNTDDITGKFGCTATVMTGESAEDIKLADIPVECSPPVRIDDILGKSIYEVESVLGSPYNGIKPRYKNARLYHNGGIYINFNKNNIANLIIINPQNLEAEPNKITAFLSIAKDIGAPSISKTDNSFSWEYDNVRIHASRFQEPEKQHKIKSIFLRLDNN